MKEYNVDLLIVGAGPVGIFSAYQGGFLGMKTLNVDALDEIGGQPQALYPNKSIHDIAGFKSILAEDLIKNLKEQAEQFSPKYLLSREVTYLERNPDQTFKVFTSKDDVIHCKAIIIAAGAGAFCPNRPPLEGIEKYEPNYVHYMVRSPKIFADKSVVIAGGGDSAVDWALELANIAKKVYVIHRRDKFRAAESNVIKMRELANTGKLELVIPYVLDALIGEKDKLQEIVVKTLQGETRNIKCDHLIALFGLARSLGSLEEWGFNINKMHSSIEVLPSIFETNIKGVFAVGDIAQYNHKLKLISIGFAEASAAIHYAWKYVFPDKMFHFTHSTSK